MHLQAMIIIAAIIANTIMGTMQNITLHRRIVDTIITEVMSNAVLNTCAKPIIAPVIIISMIVIVGIMFPVVSGYMCKKAVIIDTPPLSVTNRSITTVSAFMLMV
jgi:hypothetical protein